MGGWWRVTQVFFQSSALGDVAIVPDGSGNTCRGMLQHQAASVGCPGWAAEVQRLGEAPTVDDAGRNLPTLYGRLQYQHVVDKRRADAPQGKWLPTSNAPTQAPSNCLVDG